MGSIVADPKFASVKTGDFTIPKDSPALKTGFKPLTHFTCGPTVKPLSGWPVRDVPTPFEIRFAGK